jgi:Methane oxygenase PmoA
VGRPDVRPRPGYVPRADHGWIAHTGFDELGPEGFTEQLHWLSPAGELLLTEERRVRARLDPRGWQLEIVTALTAPGDRPVRLGSPATNGRPGAGYGGVFWRLPPPGGETATRGLRALVADGVLGDADVEGWFSKGTDQGADQGA